jgi:hypothetical protein
VELGDRISVELGDRISVELGDRISVEIRDPRSTDIRSGGCGRSERGERRKSLGVGSGCSAG